MAISVDKLSIIIETLSKEYKFDKDKAFKFLYEEDLIPKKLLPKETSRMGNAGRYEYVISAHLPSIITTMASLGLSDDIARNIVEQTYPVHARCSCHRVSLGIPSWTCSLCVHACCERAYRTPCICRCRTQCPHHGSVCFGSHS